MGNGPITWRNVSGRGQGDAALLLRGASQSLNTGLGQIDSIFDEQLKTAKKQHTAQRDLNTQSYLDELAKYRTVEDFETANQSGAFDQFLAGLGPNVDREQLRGAADDRLSDLRTAATDTYNYEQTVLDQKASPLEQQYLGLVNSGKLQEAQAFLNDNAELLTQAGDLGRLQGALKTAQQDAEDRLFTKEQRNRTRIEWGEEDRARSIEKFSSSLINETTESAGTSATLDYQQAEEQFLEKFPNATPAEKAQFRAGLFQEQAAANDLAPEDQERFELQMANAKDVLGASSNPLYLEQDYNPVEAGNEVVQTALKNPELADQWDDDDVKEAIVNNVQEALTSGITVDGKNYKLTPSMITSVLQSYDADYVWNNKAKFRAALREYVATPGYQRYLESFEQLKELDSRGLAAFKQSNGISVGAPTTPAEALAPSAPQPAAHARPDLPPPTPYQPTRSLAPGADYNERQASYEARTAEKRRRYEEEKRNKALMDRLNRELAGN